MRRSVFSGEDGTSRTFSLAVANRSLALVRLDRHGEALEDISLALEAGYPEENRYKLLERRAKCLLHLGQYREAEESLRSGLVSLGETGGDKERLRAREKMKSELEVVRSVVERRPREKVETSRATSSDVPAFSDCVEIRWSEERGRYGVATRDLLPGTNILEEEPLAARINPDLSSEYCDQCLGRAALRPVPCRACSVVYCSRGCRDRAEESHR